ncbi:replication protein P, partial [Serratia fonticola]|uniref:replication protein P n=2 Tax=Serratia fonticola TaxID=47917 RepID=UPI003AAB4764
MAGIYANRWVSKNGVQPSMIWVQTISRFSNEQLAFAAKRCMERCSAGNHWPPDLAEFTAIVGECTANPFGLTAEDVMAEYKRWRNESWRYESSESFPWKHPVLFQICTELRRAGVERKLGQAELAALAGRQLAKWAKQVEMGFSIPPIRKTKALEHRPPGESQIADADGAYKKKGMELLAKIRADAKSKIV